MKYINQILEKIKKKWNKNKVIFVFFYEKIK